MKKTNKYTLVSAVACFVLAQAASAVLIYSNNFDSESLGSVGAAGAGVVEFGDVGGPGADIDVVAAGTGFGSQHLQITSRSDNGNYGFAFYDAGQLSPAPTFDAVTTFQFDMYLTGSFTNSQFRLRTRDVAGTGGANDVSRFDLNSGSLSGETVHTIRYVVNNSTSTADVPNGTASQTIASGTFAVYVNNNAAPSFIGSNFNAADDNGLDYLTLWVRGDTTADTQATVLVDNFQLHTIPEPATLGLVAGFGGAVLFIRRRFMI